MNINFKVIGHHSQRYPTVGDYFGAHGVWNFRVSRLGNYRYEVCVFLHEIIEFMLCRVAGIKMKDIDRFDKEYEAARKKATANNYQTAEGSLIHEYPPPCGCMWREEPGDDPHAPYHQQHVTATNCERLIAEALGVKWDEYTSAVESL